MDDDALCKLQRWMERRQLSRQGLADLLGVTQPTVSKLLRGRGPGVELTEALVSVTRIPRADWLALRKGRATPRAPESESPQSEVA